MEHALENSTMFGFKKFILSVVFSSALGCAHLEPKSEKVDDPNFPSGSGWTSAGGGDPVGAVIGGIGIIARMSRYGSTGRGPTRILGNCRFRSAASKQHHRPCQRTFLRVVDKSDGHAMIIWADSNGLFAIPAKASGRYEVTATSEELGRDSKTLIVSYPAELFVWIESPTLMESP